MHGSLVNFREVVKRIREGAKEGRELEYKEGEVGITSLLQCPVKWELRQKYPDVQADAVEVDDGFVWERQVKEVLRELFGEAFEEEKELVEEVDGVKIRGHLDCFIELGDRVVGMELKAPRAVILKKFPEEERLMDGVLLIDEEGEYVIHNPLYRMQAKIQRRILEKMYPQKEVEHYLFYKAPVRRGRFERKLYILVPVKERMSDEELREVVRKFKEEKGPRFPTECEGYCEFYRQGLCEGREFRYEDGEFSELEEEVKELLKEYRNLQSQMKTVEVFLKKKIRGAVRIGRREIGWVSRKKVKLREDLVASLLPPERIPEFFTVKSGKKQKLIEELGDSIVEEVKEERVWRM